ncbi:MAG: hypothetical protein HFF30_07945 [Flavonifractor sp.]|jgi:hypothetical protein|nr:hypothetical protein [Flavonifractor sp.]MCI9425481.1 hypothetical protein [Flavonifractor sp.]MCI9474083.1 hypothetical protein [Flavonifractor sp.]
MELKILYTALPQGMDSDGLKRGLDEVLEDSGWLTGSGPGWVELELEDERQNPKYGILAVKHYLQRAALPPDTQIELAGTAVGIYE